MADATLDYQVRSLVTPEGVDLRVRLATAAERLVALMIDMTLIVVSIVLLVWGASAALQAAGVQRLEVIGVIGLLVFFLLRNFYFTLFECGRRGATPGKRIMGLRVAARNGGALNADAVVARNAMREIELYLPIMFLFSRGQEIGAVIILCGAIWCGIFALFPLFNRDRLRVGDIVAGTWVLKTPKQGLLPDLASAQQRDARFAFTEAQVNVYGVKELQVLEQVLRMGDSEVMKAVAERIRTKIEWREGLNETNRDFLSAYYAALRRRLEQRLLFGVRKRDKFDRS